MASRRTRRVVAGLVVALVLGYGAADAAEVVPGVLTTRPPYPEPVAFPTPSGRLAEPRGPADLEPRAGVPGAVQPLVDAFAADPRVTTGTPGTPRAGNDPANPANPAAPGAAQPADPTSGLAAQQSVPPGTPPSVLVVDARTRTVLAEEGATTPRLPASTLKLFTAAAALRALPGDATLATRTTLGEDDVLTLVGGGDVLLAAGAGDPGAIPGRAGIADLADATADALGERGIGEVTLHLDDSALPPEGLAPGLTPQDARWVMPPAALAVEEGASNGGRAGDPGLEAAHLLGAALTDRGIGVRAVGRGADPEGAEELAAVHSAPIADLVQLAVKESDNTLTEALGRQVAAVRGQPTDRAGSIAAVTAVLTDAGVDLTGVHFADLSGLSPHNRATAAALVGVLELGLTAPAQPSAPPGEDPAPSAGPSGTGAADGSSPQVRPAVGPAPLPALMGTLPVGGLDGTLDERMGGAAAGVARAKTGTLGAVATLAGTVLDADGRLLVYAVLVDGLPTGGLGPARAATDEFVAALAACGCR